MWVAERFVDGVHPLGSANTLLARDLKTLRGVINRIERGAWGFGEWRIYYVSESRFYHPYDGKTAVHVKAQHAGV
jgi:hypothetical protein